MRGEAARLEQGTTVRVNLVKLAKPNVEYPAEVLSDDGTHVVVRGVWSEERTGGDQARVVDQGTVELKLLPLPMGS